jgi:hypothetical protein
VICVIFSATLKVVSFQSLRFKCLQDPGCAGQVVFNGRTKSNDAGLRTFSLKCDNQTDAWEIFPDDRSKPVEFHLDPDRNGNDSECLIAEKIP